MRQQFLTLPDSRVDEAYAVLQRVAEAIRARGRRQRIAQTSLETYRQWQSDKANYIVTEDDRIAGLLTLCRETLSAWQHVVGASKTRMLRALATHPDYSGRRIGEFAVNSALTLIEPDEYVYLDCVSGFLPDYYAKLGFETVARQDHRDDDGSDWDITLMRRSGTGQSGVV